MTERYHDQIEPPAGSAGGTPVGSNTRADRLSAADAVLQRSADAYNQQSARSSEDFNTQARQESGQ